MTVALRGVRVHNLRDIDVDIPLGRLTVITGVSGAGKSSLAFDTLYAEAQRRYLQAFSAQTRQYLERFEKPDAEWIGPLPPALAVSQRTPPPPRATVGTLTEISDYLRLLWCRAGTLFCPDCGQVVRPHRVRDVVDAILAMPAATRVSVGFASRPEAADDVDAWVEARRQEGFVRVQVGATVHRLDAAPVAAPAAEDWWVLVDRVEVGKVAPERLTDSIETAFAAGAGRVGVLTDQAAQVFERRLRCPACGREFPAPDPRLLDRDDGSALLVRLHDRTIADIEACSLDELDAWVRTLDLPADMQQQSRPVVEQIQRRLEHATGLDVGYLTLARSAETLASGELRRLRLAATLASSLVQALYILDEPTVGLHPRDTSRLLAQVTQLRDNGNTVVVIEHERDIIGAADHVIDLGPGAGEEGGRVVYQGAPAGLADAPAAPTSDYWSGRSQLDVPTRRRQAAGQLRLSGARTHNLQDLSVEVPLGVLCAVTGVSGAGKSSLVEETLYPALAEMKKHRGEKPSGVKLQGAGQLEDVVLMDQRPLPRSSRSNAATYLKVFDDIRALFADTSDARIRNFGPGHFSFNQPGGRCETCEGQGSLTVDLQFLADVTAPCPECRGRRYRQEVLDIKVRSLSIAEVLDLTAREAFRFFRAQPAIQRRLKYLLDVGLDYLRLGQAADTLSGGECQRLKLAGHLASSRKPRTLFILIEPSAGLHPADVALVLGCFDRLLESGHSVLLVEHNLDMIKCADHIIDLGPGAGPRGGRMVATGTPEEVAQVAESITGQWLRSKLPTFGAGS